MSSESESKYSLEQLRQMNRKPETPAPITIQCPMDREILEELLDRQDEITRLLKTISQKLDGLATRTEQTQTRELLTAVRSMMTPPAGKKKEKRTLRQLWSRLDIHPDWGWIVLPLSFLRLLWVVWYALGVISSAV